MERPARKRVTRTQYRNRSQPLGAGSGGAGPERRHHGIILSEVTAQILKNTLVPVLDKETVLCHDGLPQYFTLARESGIPHRTVMRPMGNVWSKAFSTFRTSTPTTVGSRAGWNAFMALQPGICRIIWDGDVSLSVSPHPWFSRRGASVPSLLQLDIIPLLEHCQKSSISLIFI